MRGGMAGRKELRGRFARRVMYGTIRVERLFVTKFLGRGIFSEKGKTVASTRNYTLNERSESSQGRG